MLTMVNIIAVTHCVQLERIHHMTSLLHTRPLSDLKPGESGTILEIGGEGNLRQRLIAMGVTPGTWLTVRKYAPLGDPMEIRLRNYNLSIRKKDAASIIIQSEATS